MGEAQRGRYDRYRRRTEIVVENFRRSRNRTFAVKRLSKASDAELNAYLLQLVAALRYEPKRIATWEDFESPPLARLLVERACRAKAPYRLANFLYWYLKVEIDAVQVRSKNNKDNPPLPHDEENGQMYAKVLQALFDRLAETAPNVKDALDRQAAVFKTISDYQLDSKEIRGNRDAKLKDLKSKLKNIAQRGFDPLVSSPLNPNVQLKNIMPSETHMFKSALYPAKIVFERIPNVEGKEAWVAEEPAARRGNPPPTRFQVAKASAVAVAVAMATARRKMATLQKTKRKSRKRLYVNAWAM